MSDLDEMISIVSARSEEHCLVEIGHGIRNGERATTGFVWSSGRIGATLDAREVRLRRRLGPMGTSGGITLSELELTQRAVACEDWAARRDDWWAFYDSSAGFSDGHGRGLVHVFAGSRERTREVGLAEQTLR